MSADELRKAAEKLREQAYSAHADMLDLPWKAERVTSRSGEHKVTSVFSGRDEAVFEDEYASLDDAAYIATMHPGVGLALADWLEFVWSMGEPGRKRGLTGEAYDTAQALAVARLIIGGA